MINLTLNKNYNDKNIKYYENNKTKQSELTNYEKDSLVTQIVEHIDT